MSKYVITGGPCSGKTTTLNALSFFGFETIAESARQVIEREQTLEQLFPEYTPIVPWTDVAKFQSLVLDEQQRKEQRITKDAFLDRSYIDGIAYAELSHVPMDERVHDLIAQANYSKVFFLDTLACYEIDGQRKESYADALRIRDMMLDVYSRYTDVTFLPDCSLRERVNTILEEIEYHADVRDYEQMLMR